MRFLLSVFALVFVSAPASAKITCVQELLPGVQVHAGVHLTVSGGKVGVGASVDALGGLGYGSWCGSMPGVAAGPFAEVNAVLSEGTSLTWGGRASVGAMVMSEAPSFFSTAMASFDYGRSLGARTGTRKGLRLRSYVGDAAYSWYDEGPAVFTAGAVVPALPLLLER